MASREAHERIEKLLLHQQQVDAGLIPEDSPPTFVRPEGDAALVNNLPWWFGPDYHPTPEAIAEFSRPIHNPPELMDQPRSEV
ncbi:MAG: hypothetical protein ABSE98_06260 [Acidimicrobiales bacterium]|jgi:hypothetical protein